MSVAGADSTGLLEVQGKGRAGLLAAARQRLAETVETESRRTTIWASVVLVFGIWAYFGLRQEPAAALIISFLLVVPVLLWQGRRYPLANLLAALIFGFAIAGVRSWTVATPLLRAYSPDVVVTGHVADVNALGKARATLLIDVDEVVGLPPDEKPRRLRLRAGAEALQAHIGDMVRGTASLTPLPRPVVPGGYDAARGLYFQSVGAVGWFTSPVTVSQDGVALRYVVPRSFHALRQAIGTRVRAAIPGPLGSFADALITGERAAIPKAMTESLQKSGLYHILSISGLHMAIVAGGSYWLIRAVLALFPMLALSWPIKKWAAGAALVVGLIYDLMADSGPATDRSFIMIAVMLFAVIVDRSAISLHNLAIAALIILTFQPEQAVAASFQMSFMAVAGLAGFFEWWNARDTLQADKRQRGLMHYLNKFWNFAVASVLTSLIAGTLSGIPAAHHFGRLSPYGVVANALALPVVGIVMPAALCATLLMPFGLEALPLWVMEQGLKVTMLISDWVAGWPFAGLAMPPLAAAPAAALALAAVLAFMGRGLLRLAGLVPLALVVPLWMSQHLPDVLVEDRGRAVAVLGAGGDYWPAPGSSAGGTVRKWRELAGHREKQGAKAAGPWTCKEAVCTAQAGSQIIVYLQAAAEPAEPCPSADVLVAAYPLHRRCKGKFVTIDRFDVWRRGAHAITIASNAVATAQQESGARPWVYVPRPRLRAQGPVTPSRKSP